MVAYQCSNDSQLEYGSLSTRVRPESSNDPNSGSRIEKRVQIPDQVITSNISERKLNFYGQPKSRNQQFGSHDFFQTQSTLSGQHQMAFQEQDLGRKLSLRKLSGSRNGSCETIMISKPLSTKQAEKKSPRVLKIKKKSKKTKKKKTRTEDIESFQQKIDALLKTAIPQLPTYDEAVREVNKRYNTMKVGSSQGIKTQTKPMPEYYSKATEPRKITISKDDENSSIPIIRRRLSSSAKKILESARSNSREKKLTTQIEDTTQ